MQWHFKKKEKKAALMQSDQSSLGSIKSRQRLFSPLDSRHRDSPTGPFDVKYTFVVFGLDAQE